ncbi:MAG: DUF192 domain-containing protein [Candidatus Saccharimonadales bacterium]
MNTEKKSLSWVMIIFILLLVGLAALYIVWPQLQPHTTIRIGDGIYTSQIANTEALREKGLSGTTDLRSNQALLFVFDSDRKWPIWMKDMNYPIDIVWLDKDKKVVYIVTNAPPDSYPYTIFTPNKEARYVVELPAGTAMQKAIKVDGVATFDETKKEGFGL